MNTITLTNQPKMNDSGATVTWWEILKAVGSWSLTILVALILPAVNKWRKARKAIDESKRLAAKDLADDVKSSLNEQKLLRADIQVIVEGLSKTDLRITDLHTDFKTFKNGVDKKFDTVEGHIYDLQQRLPIK